MLVTCFIISPIFSPLTQANSDKNADLCLGRIYNMNLKNSIKSCPLYRFRVSLTFTYSPCTIFCVDEISALAPATVFQISRQAGNNNDIHMETLPTARKFQRPIQHGRNDHVGVQPCSPLSSILPFRFLAAHINDRLTPCSRGP